MTDVETPPDGGTIVVSGTGRVAVEPDIADLRLGVSVSRPTVDAARCEAAASWTRSSRPSSRPASRARTCGPRMLSVQPRYDYRDGSAPALTGYELANSSR